MQELQDTPNLSLLKALQQIISGLADPTKHYMVNANYYEHLPSGAATSERWYIACIYFHQEAAWNVELTVDGLACDVLLNRNQPEEKFRIKIPYEEIWEVLERNDSSHVFTTEGRIFYNAQAMKRLSPSI
ncbi:hypothetical protein EFA69_06120 [Rufibacter immobilis]|uniref:Uncharacterized protein n=1 Tax=Rufibacter immobilis TaxID=1348778 RepID=A0A3M9N3K8_9BACT|nr:hypothetical protein [Rufibacter immobilis]RNI31773.1 hypothetical protein EFA69_06120 [Rufibacter immobilis]